tara:strand:- start:134 stop:328 length:195 start_codon:yes stop_codon:yes gene_type:complete
MNTLTLENEIKTDFSVGPLNWYQDSEKLIFPNSGVSIFNLNTIALEIIIQPVESHYISNPTWLN